MSKKVGKGLIAMVLTITLIGFVGSALAQDKPADNMDLVKEKIRTDKKLFIATNMQLTESEAKAFWPVYQDYQAELAKLRDREIKLIEEFAAKFETMSDDVAKKLLDDAMSIDSDHQKLLQSYLSKFRGIVSDKKVARYYQLESKIDAVLEYEMAKRIPLVQ
jgi:cell division protein FtsI/penicillin-binding protein 2